MYPATIIVPEPFCSALENANADEVCDWEASTPQALVGRAWGRMAVGRENDARADLQAALPALGDVCRVELALLDLQQRASVREALAVAKRIANSADPETALAARARHVIGLAEGKLRNPSQAVDALLRAAAVYRALGLRLQRAHVLDALGTAEAARGRLDNAAHFYALSLVEKTRAGDQRGMALTIGNMGRLHLRAGRYRDAIDCFELDLEMATEQLDLRGEARMREDLGRAYLGLEEHDLAEYHLVECLQLAKDAGLNDLLFFAHKDLALLRIAEARFAEAKTELGLAEQAMPADAESYFPLILKQVAGELALAEDDASAAPLLEEAVRGFEDAQLPDLEIPARLALARAFVAEALPAAAEKCLLRGMKLARSDGYARYLPVLNEAMASLDLTAGAVHESDRQIGDEREVPAGSYIIREKLGGGGFGDVYRVFDPQRGRDLALKRLRLEGLYDVGQRKQLRESARMELEAASRLRHPGVAKVLAIGTDADGSTYVVQEYIHGCPLGELLPDDNQADETLVIRCLVKIASALQALHEAGVVHRDLKPGNVLIRNGDLTEGGAPVLVDFGIARVLQREGSSRGQVLGTIAYMAPEQALGEAVSGREDLYSLGVLAYRWLSGTLPLRPRGWDFQEMLDDIRRRPPVPLRDFRPHVNPGLEKLVMSLLAKQPEERPRYAAEAIRRLTDSCR